MISHHLFFAALAIGAPGADFRRSGRPVDRERRRGRASPMRCHHRANCSERGRSHDTRQNNSKDEGKKGKKTSRGRNCSSQCGAAMLLESECVNFRY